MKKTLIRTLTFILGLYFILEFFLPEEIGGDFDKAGLRTPCIFHGNTNEERRLYYVGEFDLRNQAVGLAVADDEGKLQKIEGNPVLKSTLFNSVDRFGFKSISVIRSAGKYLMFYIGLDPDRNTSICWAESEDGIRWQKHNRVSFEKARTSVDRDLPWCQSYEMEESVARHHGYGKLYAVAAFDDNDVPSVLIALANPDGESEIWAARYDASGEVFLLDKTPFRLNEDLQFESVRSMSVVSNDNSLELWTVLSNGKLYKSSLDPQPEIEMEEMEFLTSAESELNDQQPDIEIMETEFPTITEGELNELQTVIRAGGELYELSIAKNGAFYEAYFIVQDDEGDLVNGIFAARSEDGQEWTGMYDSEAIVQWGGKGQSTFLSEGVEFGADCLAIIGSFAIFLGVINMCLVHGKNIIRTRKEVYNSIIFFVFLIVMFMFTLRGKPAGEIMESEKMTMLSSMASESRDEADGLLNSLKKANEWVPEQAVRDIALAHAHPPLAPVLVARIVYNLAELERMKTENPLKADILLKTAKSVKHYAKKDVQKVVEEKTTIPGMEPLDSHEQYSGKRIFAAKGYNFIFKFFMQSLGTSVFALISFYMVGAAFRSFRIKSAEALLLIISAVIVMLGQIPIGNLISPYLPKAGQKLLLVVNAAAYRGVVLGMMVGGLSMALRLWLGLERGMFHGTE